MVGIEVATVDLLLAKLLVEPRNLRKSSKRWGYYLLKLLQTQVKNILEKNSTFGRLFPPVIENQFGLSFAKTLGLFRLELS